MATSVRGSANGGKEKRGTSPSQPNLKKSIKPSSSSTNEEKLSSTSETTKPIPNYLKPTVSSSHDSSRLPKKASPDTSTRKPELNRRRSFDRPPPSSQVQRAFRSPPSGSRDIKTQRSTSFSSKSNTSSATSSMRPTSERLYARTSSLKDKKVVEEPRMSRSRSVKKSTLSSTSSRKTPTSASSSMKKAPKSVNSESSADHESPSVDHVGTEEDDLVNLDEHEVQSLPEMSEMPDNNEELADPTNIEVEAVKHVEEDPKGSPKEKDEDHHDHLLEDKSTVVDDQVVLEEGAAEQECEKSDDHQTVAEESAAADQPQVEAAEEQNVVEITADQKDEAEKTVPEEEPTETVVVEEEKAKETEPEKEDQEVTDDKEVVSSPPADAAAAPAEAAAAPANAQSSADKKDKQAYNDVIEETATKLRGKKNKVLALAGAFETVISLQDTTKS